MRLTTPALLLALATAVFAQPTGRLVGSYSFEEAAGSAIRDASGAGHHGEILNDARGVKRVTGRHGGALEFVGGDPAARNQAGCVVLSGFEDVDFSKGLTVEAWVQPTALIREQTYELVSNTENDRGKGFRLVLAYNMLWLRSGEGGAGKTWAAQSKSAEFVPAIGQWYHFAGTYDGSVFRVYVDGVLKGESEPGLALTKGLPKIYVGAYGGGYAYGLNAVIDDVRLYDYARPDSDLILDARLRD